MRSTEIALRYTCDFVRAELGARRRILEVGCGGGELAAALLRDHRQVLAVDVSEEAVREARGRGVAAECCDFVRFAPARSFEAVLFTRSLHHIHPLEDAIARAFELLEPGGLVLMEDFDHAAMDHDTARWLHSAAEALRIAAIAEAGEFPDLADLEPLEHWRREHAEEPPLHSGPQMAAAVRARFGTVRQMRCCYLFRNLIADLRESPGEHAIAARLLEWETSLIEHNRIAAIGFRLVAER